MLERASLTKCWNGLYIDNWYVLKCKLPKKYLTAGPVSSVCVQLVSHIDPMVDSYIIIMIHQSHCHVHVFTCGTCIHNVVCQMMCSECCWWLMNHIYYCVGVGINIATTCSSSLFPFPITSLCKLTSLAYIPSAKYLSLINQTFARLNHTQTAHQGSPRDARGAGRARDRAGALAGTQYSSTYLQVEGLWSIVEVARISILAIWTAVHLLPASNSWSTGMGPVVKVSALIPPALGLPWYNCSGHWN